LTPISAKLFCKRSQVTLKDERPTSNIERPTSNFEWEKMKKQTYDLEERPLIKKSELLNDILEETEIAVECSVSDIICFSFDVGHSMLDVHLFPVP
jgi:hypothetical protein